MTVECPDEIKVPYSAYGLYTSGNYWILSSSTVHHQGKKQNVEFNLGNLKVSDTIGCSIHEDGTLHFYVNGKDKGVSWYDKLPVNQTVYGIVDVYGKVTKIRSLYHYGKLKCMLTWLSYDYWLLMIIYHSVLAFTVLKTFTVSDCLV